MQTTQAGAGTIAPAFLTLRRVNSLLISQFRITAAWCFSIPELNSQMIG
jgi:hypothetical protein